MLAEFGFLNQMPEDPRLPARIHDIDPEDVDSDYDSDSNCHQEAANSLHKFMLMMSTSKEVYVWMIVYEEKMWELKNKPRTSVVKRDGRERKVNKRWNKITRHF